MKYDIILRGGTVVDSLNNIEGVYDIGIRDGKVISIEKENFTNNSNQIIDVRGKIVIPGLVDSHVHIVRPDSGAAGYRMLIRAGVTTAVDFRGPVERIGKEIGKVGYGLNAAVLDCISPDYDKSSASRLELNEKISESISKGALGIKIIGGHFPLTPETTRDIIEVANEKRIYAAFHAGTTKCGSNIEGMREAIELSSKLLLHLAHINSYCRGLIETPLEEALMAINLLKANPNIVSESYLSPLNGTSGEFNSDGLPKSHVTRNCLKKLGYEISQSGMKKAFLDKKVAVYEKIGEEMELIWGEEAFELWYKSDTRVNISFIINSRMAATLCAGEKDDKERFVIDALSTDGGAIPRNTTIECGLPLVRFGIFTLKEFVWKACYAPAQMFGFKNKGHLSYGADADITVIDPKAESAVITICNGKLSMINEYLINNSGKLMTTEMGADYLRDRFIPYEIVDLEESTFYSGRDRLYKNIK
ncbi:MAG: amidohydrolase family protein [Clostridiaceae bacterium]